jgi:hypothetical protein
MYFVIYSQSAGYDSKTECRIGLHIVLDGTLREPFCFSARRLPDAAFRKVCGLLGEERSLCRIRSDSRIGNESRKYAVRSSAARRPVTPHGGINRFPAAEMFVAIDQRLGRQSLALCRRRPKQQSQEDGETKLKVARKRATVAALEGAIPLEVLDPLFPNGFQPRVFLLPFCWR